MSTYTERAAIITRPDLSPRARLLALRILDMQDLSKGRCLLSNVALAAELGCSERQVRRAFSELRAAGLLSEFGDGKGRRIVPTKGRTDLSPSPDGGGQIRPATRTDLTANPDRSVPQNERERERTRQNPPTPPQPPRPQGGGERWLGHALIDAAGAALVEHGKRWGTPVEALPQRMRGTVAALEGVDRGKAVAWCREWAADASTQVYTAGSLETYVRARANGAAGWRARGGRRLARAEACELETADNADADVILAGMSRAAGGAYG